MNSSGDHAIVHTTCCYRSGPVDRLAKQLFDDSVQLLASFLHEVLSQPIVFTNAQRDFYLELSRRGAFVDTADRRHVPVLQLVGTEYAQTGVRHCVLVNLVDALCGTLADVGTRFRPEYTSMHRVPCRLARAALFWSAGGAFPLRTWFLTRFFARGTREIDDWLAGGPMHVVQTPEFLDMMFFETAMRECDTRLLSEAARSEMRHTLHSDDQLQLWTHSGAAQRMMELSTPRQVLAFYTYFMHRLVLHTGTIERAQCYFEVAFAMLMGWRLDITMPMATAIRPSTLTLLSEVAEHMRDFIAAPATCGVPLLRALYARTSDFDKTFLANQSLREMMMSRDTARRHMQLWYVPVSEDTATRLVATLVTTHQVAQVRALSEWLQQVDSDIVHALNTQDAECRAAFDARFYACRFPAGVHVHRLRWTMDYYRRAAGALANALPYTSFVGMDEQNMPYLLMQRRDMEVLRLVMLADALTLRNFRKNTVIYPLLLRMYLTRSEHSELALMVMATVLAYWLCVPTDTDSAIFARRGMPALGEHCGHLRALEHVVSLLFRQSAAEAGHTGELHQHRLVGNMSALNAIRSFLMIRTAHTLSLPLLDLVRQAAHAARHSDDYAHLDDALGALATVHQAAAAGATLRRVGRPSTKMRAPTDRVDGSLCALPEFEMALSADNRLRRLDPNERRHTLNMWIYRAALELLPPAQAYTLLCDFAVTLPPLSEIDYRRTKYNCPPDYVAPWRESNAYMRTIDHARYCHTGASLQPHDPDSVHCLLVFLQQLEIYICQGDTAHMERRVRHAPADTSDESSLAMLIERIHRDPERLLASMPVSAYFNRGCFRYELASFEHSLCVADVAPASTQQNVPLCQLPHMCVGSARDTQMADVAVDLVTMFGRDFREGCAQEPALCQRVFQQITQARTAGDTKAK